MNNEYICNDNKIEVSEKIANMKDEEIEKEFEQRFSQKEDKTE